MFHLHVNICSIKIVKNFTLVLHEDCVRRACVCVFWVGSLLVIHLQSLLPLQQCVFFFQDTIAEVIVVGTTGRSYCVVQKR